MLVNLMPICFGQETVGIVFPDQTHTIQMLIIII